MTRGQALCVCIVFAVAITTLWSSLQSAANGTALNGQKSVFAPDLAIVTVPGLNLSIEARPAAFGPSFNVSGRLCVVNSLACDSSAKSGAMTSSQRYDDCIALVLRGGCGFYEKVVNLQHRGAAAVIVGDNVPNRGLVTMYNGDVLDAAEVASFFVSFASYKSLLTAEEVNIMLVGGWSFLMDTLLFFLVSPLCSLAIIYGVLVFHRRYRLRKERASKSYVQSLPTRIWYAQPGRPSGGSGPSQDRLLEPGSGHVEQHPDVGTDCADHAEPAHGDGGSESVQLAADSEWPANAENSASCRTCDTIGKDLPGDMSPPNTPSPAPEKRWVSSDECAICLEDYVDGITCILKLPCNHEFHVDCITRWLVSRRKTCPLCKHDATQPITETTPLLPS